MTSQKEKGKKVFTKKKQLDSDGVMRQALKYKS